MQMTLSKILSNSDLTFREFFLKDSLRVYNFCYNSTMIQIIVILWQSNSQITVHIFNENFAINVLFLNASFKTKHISKDIYQK